MFTRCAGRGGRSTIARHLDRAATEGRSAPVGIVVNRLTPRRRDLIADGVAVGAPAALDTLA